MPAKPHKLMRTDVIRNKDIILNHDMTGERDFIREDVVASDHAVVRHVATDHEKVARSDARRLAFATGPVKRTKLPNQVIVANFEITLLPAEFNVMRLAAHYCMLENAVAIYQYGVALYVRSGGDLAIWAYFDVIFDVRCGMDLLLQGVENNRIF